MVSEQSETITCRPSQLPLVLQYVWLTGRVPLIKGAPGIAKTQIHYQVGAALGMRVVPYRLAQRDATAFGIPVPDLERGLVRWMADELWPTEPVIIFLDELNRAPMLIQNMAFQLIEEGRIGNLTLPPGTYISAAVNRDTDRGVIPMPEALNNRFVNVTLVHDLEDWSRWAVNGEPQPIRIIERKPTTPGIHMSVVGYLRMRPENAHRFPARGTPEALEPAWPSYRSWEFLSDLVKQDPPDEILRIVAAGCVGTPVAVDYLGYLAAYRSLTAVSIDALMLAPDTYPVPDAAEGGLLYALASVLSQRADDMNIDRVLTYLERMPSEEYSTFAVTMARARTVRTDGTSPLDSTPAFQRWAINHPETRGA